MSSMKIFVKLLGEGTDAWRATNARPIADDVFEVLGIERPDEKWEFAPGTRVRCAPRKFSNGSMELVATGLEVN
jgi:hypothetical protein